jgi:hypothetical protein
MRWTALALATLGLSFALSNSQTSAGVVSRQLSTSIPELRFQGVTFGDAIDFIRDVSGANITVNWKAIESTGVTRDSQVNLHLTGVKLRKALEMLLTEVAGGDSITYVVDQGVIEVTSRELADKMLITRVYPVEDLIMVIPDFSDAPQFSLEAAQNGGGGGSSSSGSGQGSQATVANQLFTGAGQAANTEQVKTKSERAQELVDLIEAVVFPDIWKENGGTSSVRYYNGMLVVTAPRTVQESIGGEYD